MLAVISIIFIIGASVSYFMGATDLLDAEIRSLGATQQLSFQKSEIEISVQRWLEGRPNRDCPATLRNTLLSSFSNFSQSDSAAARTFAQTPGSSVSMLSFAAAQPAVGLPCFMHPTRYKNFSMKNFKAEFFRMGQPNYQGLSTDVAVKISFEFVFRQNSGANKVFRQKYNLRYRLEGSSLGNYGLILANSPVGTPAFVADNPNTTSIQVHGRTLVLGAPPELSSLAWYGSTDTTTTLFRDEVHLSATHVVVDNAALNYVSTKGLGDIFTRGILTEAVPDESTTTGYVAPVRAPYDHLQEAFNPYYWDAVGHLPFTNSFKSASVSAVPGGDNFFADRIGTTTLSVTDATLTNTASTFANPRLGGNANKVFETCKLDDATNARPMVWSNINTTLTIDLSANDSAATPPVFCGVIAAREIVVRLNGADPASPYSHHYLIGKFLVTDSIRVIGSGKLHLIDGASFQTEDVPLPGLMHPNPSIMASHLNAFSYSTYRNFHLPFLRPGIAYTSLPTELAWIRPMSVVQWMFSNACPPPAAGYSCLGVMTVPQLVLDPATGRPTYPLIDQALPNIFFTARSAL